MTLLVLILCAAAIVIFLKRTAPKIADVRAPRPRPFTDTPECRIAVHEAGHAVAAWSCTCVTGMIIATIETETGGVVEYTIHSSETPDGMWCLLTITLAGVAAETFVHGKAGTLSSETDLIKARKLAEQIAAKGWASPWKLEGEVPKFDIYDPPLKPQEVEVLQHSFRMAKHIVRAHDRQFHRMVVLLLTHKTVRESDVENVLGRRNFTKVMGLVRPTFIVPKKAA